MDKISTDPNLWHKSRWYVWECALWVDQGSELTERWELGLEHVLREGMRLNPRQGWR